MLTGKAKNMNKTQHVQYVSILLASVHRLANIFEMKFETMSNIMHLLELLTVIKVIKNH